MINYDMCGFKIEKGKCEYYVYLDLKNIESIRQGIEQAGKGQVKSRGSFAKYVEGDL